MLKSVASVSLVVVEFVSFNLADEFSSFNENTFKETPDMMSTTKFLRIVGKLLSFCMTIGMAVVHAVKVRRARRGSSWLQRSRYGGTLERIHAIARRVLAAAVILLILLIVVTTEWW
ncbi:hypothetical protein [Actinophytocola algeriensis]|uniref:Uncharacterized protein n=1 Tax=Actinophytocola algeriensis TaxID=1768010 RepID=A0A7W7QBN8_9PSEU|nr:hypothetical protein [Actinophytocola algeriensis]MBB4910600.1 hypothetical protein [Actinophytocola algeriensis]MBE1480412.1 hypothetical protein [Actinophytocola algeriensis]